MAALLHRTIEVNCGSILSKKVALMTDEMVSG